jgi:hypothetical protein
MVAKWAREAHFRQMVGEINAGLRTGEGRLVKPATEAKTSPKDTDEEWGD